MRAEQEVRGDRRRLLIAGLVAAPFMLTLASRPAMATTGGTLGHYSEDYGGGFDGGDGGGMDDDTGSGGSVGGGSNRPGGATGFGR